MAGPLVVDLGKKAIRAEFGSDLLAGLSIVTSAFVGEYLAGSIVVLMLSGGTALEQYATRRASAVLGALAKRLPSAAHRLAGSKIVDIDLDEVKVGDLLTVFPHEICPVDGIVTDGHGTMDESYLTGEPYLISKTIGASVLCCRSSLSHKARMTGRSELQSKYLAHCITTFPKSDEGSSFGRAILP